jgi:extradiol dioxygenase family protein
MALLKLNAVVHWSIPVNNLEEAEDFYGEILGLEHVGRLATSRMSCFTLGGHNIILCERKNPIVRTIEEDGRLHHAFDVSPEMFNKACKVSGTWALRSTSLSTIVPAVSLPGDNCSFSIPAGTGSSSAIRPGRRECRLRVTRKSATSKVRFER